MSWTIIDRSPRMLDNGGSEKCVKLICLEIEILFQVYLSLYLAD